MGNSDDTWGESGKCRPLSQVDMVLVALGRVAGGTIAKIPYEELVLQAWRDFPEAFSLRNHPEHPDASDIHKKLYDSLKRQGLVLPLGNKMFRLTDKGVEHARRLDDALQGPSRSDDRAPKTRLSREKKNFLEHAVGTAAFKTWCTGEAEKLIAYDARTFFQFSTGTPVKDRRLRVQFAKESIAAGRELGVSTAVELERLSDYLAETFGDLFEEA